MASALQHVAWEPCLLETRPDRALESYARRKQGIPNPSIPYFVSVPWLARAVIDLHPEYGLLVHLDQNVADLVALVVSQENSCRFCYAGVRALLWGQGMSKVRIQRVEQDLMRADLPPRTVAAIAFGRSQSRSGPPGAREAREALRRAGFSDDEMKEIAYAVANTDFSNRAHTILAIPSLALERLPDRLHMRLFRPLIKRILQSHHSRGRATALDSVPSYPYARLVKAYAGSPIAPALGRTLEEMWASQHLTRRCKLLILAIVARGLPPCARRPPRCPASRHRRRVAAPHRPAPAGSTRDRGAARGARHALRAGAHARGAGEGDCRARGHLRRAGELSRSRAGDGLTRKETGDDCGADWSAILEACHEHCG
jgi:AhpD family alkylhydroperoxidase